jgi:uncharacterized protein
MPKSDPKPPWWSEGLRFTCTACGDCCTGESGYIWVNKAEIEAMAARCGLTPEEFERQHVVSVGVRKSLRERPGGDCVMLDEATRKCSVYTDRPRQCRTWPFWDSNLRTPEAWAETCAVCPGSGKGKLYSLEAIDEQRKVIRI